MRILLIEDNPGDIRLVQEMLKVIPGDFIIDAAHRLRDGLQSLRSQNADVVLLDLNLPDSRGLETLAMLRSQFPQLPVVVMTSADDEELAIEAVREGAEDYLVKGQTDGRLLRRALLYAVERKRISEALRESEERFHSLVRNSPDMISRFDTQLRYLYANPAAQQAAGLPLEAFVGKTTEELGVPPEMAALGDQKMKEVINSGEPATVEYSYPSLVGVRYYQTTITPELAADGSVKSLLNITHDLTERRKTEEAKDEFIGLVSHEIRTPLTVLMGAIGVAMSEGMSPEDVRSMLQEAMQGAKSLAHIVENLLELSRYQANRMALAKERLDVVTIAQAAVEEKRRQDPNHKFSLDVDGVVPVIEADRIRVEHILGNLLDNAIKYSPDGTEIRVSLAREGDHLLVGVRDRGKGISAEDQAKLFQPFQRVGETARTTGGLGLGLLVCKRLVEVHGGRIWVESGLGRGATFCFTLPVGQSS